ncbi:MAG: hypothetical protein JNM99_03595 [Verrucomicrobiaceae bacterium]|nr:hypothetical protein [Verrucomicrobiaceae bacterium]
MKPAPFLFAVVTGLSFALGAEVRMETKVFHIPPDFLTWSRPSSSGGAASSDPFTPVPADPFAPKAAPVPKPSLPNSKDILEAQGIQFPEGSSVSFDPFTGILRVTNTKANLDLVDTFVGAMKDRGPINLSFHLQTFQLPAAAATVLMHATTSTADHTAELERLVKAAADPASNVKAVADSFVRTKSGQRVRIAAERQHTYISEADVGKDGHLHNLAQEIRGLGFNVEIDPVLGPDGATIDVNIASTCASAPPDEGSETSTDLLSGKGFTTPTSAFHVKTVQTALSLISGSSKLLNIWKPTGKPEFETGDVRWVSFLTARKVPVETLPRVHEVPGAAGRALPEGWKSLAFPIPSHLQITDDETFGRARGEGVEECLQRLGAQLPAGSRAGSTPDGQLLVTSSLDALANVSEIVWGMTQRMPHGLAFTFHTIRAPSALMRPLVTQAQPTSDQREMLRALLAAVDQGKAQCVDTSYTETKSGWKASVNSITEQPFISDFIGRPTPKPEDKAATPPKKAGHARGPEFEMLPLGTKIELDPVLGPDGTTIDLTAAYKRHTAPPEERWLEFRDPAHSSMYRLPFLDSHQASIETSVILTDQGTQLLGVYRPSGVNEDVLEAVWVTAEVTQLVSQKITKNATENPDVIDPDDPTLHTRVFSVPRDFIVSVSSSESNKDASKPHVESNNRTDAKSILHSKGINFPEGASVIYGAATSQLIVRNTTANLDRIDDYFRDLDAQLAKNLSFTLHLFEAPGPVLRRLITERGAIQDHRPMLDALRAAADQRQARSLSTLRLETKSGQRATASDGIEKPFISEVGISDDGQPFINHAIRTLGPGMEVDPVLGADGWTLDLNIAIRYTTAPPEDYTLRYTDPPTGHELTIPQFRFHQTETTTAVTLQDGTVKLISMWKPTGPAFDGKDVLQCALIEGHVVTAK